MKAWHKTIFTFRIAEAQKVAEEMMSKESANNPEHSVSWS